MTRPTRPVTITINLPDDPDAEHPQTVDEAIKLLTPEALHLLEAVFAQLIASNQARSATESVEVAS